ncbi:MAG: glycosyltransferase family 2 protein [Acidimicrobiales bacterium]
MRAPSAGDGPGAEGAGVAGVVVSYNASAHLEHCLASLGRNGVATVVVVDNGSKDESRGVAEGAGATWVDAGANLGYGRAANVGAATAGARSEPYILVCNPDLEVGAGAVPALVAALEADRGLGVVGPRIDNPDGTLYPSARTFPSLLDAFGHGLLGMFAPRNRFTRRYRLLDWDHGAAARVDWISGACLLARREAWEAVRGFDPVYFMYMEDVDLCWRLARAGWSVGYEPAAGVVHVQGVSTSRRPYRMLAAHHLSMWLFANRTTSGARRAVLPVVAAGLAARFAVNVAASVRARNGQGFV